MSRKDHTPQVGDDAYDPSLDPLFLEQVQSSEPSPAQHPHTEPLPVKDGGGGYADTGYTAEELVAAYGTNPDGSPRTEAVPDTPSCPTVSPDGYPFDTTAIPAGCGEPLSAECAAYYNARYAPTKTA